VSTDNQPQQLRIVSQAQYGFFNRRLRYMSEHGLDTDPETGIDRQTIVQALQAVRYADLPPKAGRSTPKTWQPPAQPKAPPRIEGIKIGGRTVCYLVHKPRPIFFIANAEVWDKIHEAMPDVKRSQCMTLKEARGFLEIGEDKIKSLKEAASLWASDCPAEAVLPTPKAPVDDKPWVDDENPFADSTYADEDDDNEVFN
jgi:hypothetical protein